VVSCLQLLGRLRSGGSQFQDIWAEKFVRHHLNEKKMGMLAHVFHPSNVGKHKIGKSQSRLAWAKIETLCQNNQSKNGWGA
jgi:hypothetical protein